MTTLHTPEVGSRPERILQGANDLLELLSDDSIWSQLVQSGFQRDGRLLLASALDAARRGYQLHREQLEHSGEPGGGGDAALAVALGASQEADAGLNRVMVTVCTAGQLLFRKTASLTRRFTIPESLRPGWVG